ERSDNGAGGPQLNRLFWLVRGFMHLLQNRDGGSHFHTAKTQTLPSGTVSEEMMKKINRRHFLNSAAAIATGSLIAKASAPNPTGANDRVRVAVIGLRSRGKEHTEEFFKLRPMNVEVAALC